MLDPALRLVFKGSPAEAALDIFSYYSTRFPPRPEGMDQTCFFGFAVGAIGMALSSPESRSALSSPRAPETFRAMALDYGKQQTMLARYLQENAEGFVSVLQQIIREHGENFDA